ncbi:PREDICTED: transcription factor bHLH110-like isoform X2 [Populus euphratica]|uniref:Transcription factor bHLH110-like isoform X2 n=1 Tax=Populus euphratica TaxID=75702 RepID=A0AAJ6XN77_POPEU|nr:PREDICTED: transcription factor bHLH110-like isoform X2 [Populus euphratica]
MRNALLPPVSSHLYNFGNNEVQMPNLDVSMPMDDKMNVHGTTSFYLDSKVFNDDHQQRDGGFSIPYQSLGNYQPVAGYQSISSTCNNISQQSMLLSKRVSVPEVQMEFQAMQIKKRTINELANLLPQRGPSDLVENKTALSTWKTNKRKKANSPGELWNHQAMESINIQEQKFQVPVRRSQKLSDKITALQKLVSPYGKTDTASVLQEASLYIKLLQEQIQNLIQMLTSSYSRARPIQQSQEIEGRLVDLRSRGLCFVPISLMQKMTQQQDHVDPSSYPRKNISATTF